VQRTLAARGARGYLAGGAVRDALLGRPIADLDVAVAAPPESVAGELAAAFAAPSFPLDAERGIYRLALDGGRLVLDLTPLAGEIAQDARRRDFTIDALALPLESLAEAVPAASAILDAVGGLADLERRTVRAIADDVFREDAARLLRAVRLAAELSFTIEPATGGLIRRDAALLATVAGERVRDELFRTLAVPGAAGSLRLLDDLGLLTRIFPELEAARGAGQPKEHYWDVLQHSIEAVAEAERVVREVSDQAPGIEQVPWDDELSRRFAEEVSGGRSRRVLLKLAALLHDVAKPATKTIEADGRIRFLGHPRLGARMTETALSRLRLSARETRAVVAMVEEHLRPGLITRDDGPSGRALYRYFRDAGEVAIDTLFLSLADSRAARGPLLELEDWRLYAGKIRGMLDAWRGRTAAVQPPRLVDGHDLMRELGLRPGPRIGELLETVREAQAAGEIATRSEAIALAARLERQGPPTATPDTE
jgi:poly(A) polymerase